jgi:hypothetical protein
MSRVKATAHVAEYKLLGDCYVVCVECHDPVMRSAFYTRFGQVTDHVVYDCIDKFVKSVETELAETEEN